jgi:hypothetical protein
MVLVVNNRVKVTKPIWFLMRKGTFGIVCSKKIILNVCLLEEELCVAWRKLRLPNSLYQTFSKFLRTSDENIETVRLLVFNDLSGRF